MRECNKINEEGAAREELGHLLDRETYDMSGIEKFLDELKKDHKKLKQFRKLAVNRAEDIFESGQLEKEFSSSDKVLYIGAGAGHVAQLIEAKTKSEI